MSERKNGDATGAAGNGDASEFALPDHEEKIYEMDDLIGKKGLLICFLNDIWLRASAERIRWLQQHYLAFEQLGVGVVMVVGNQPHTLHGYYVSSPLPPRFIFLADSDQRIHRDFDMERRVGLLLMDKKRTVRKRWLISEQTPWPRARDIKSAIKNL